MGVCIPECFYVVVSYRLLVEEELYNNTDTSLESVDVIVGVVTESLAQDSK
jgi:hypothetical protein